MTVVRLALLIIAAHNVLEAASLLPGQFGGLNRITAASSSPPHCLQLHQIRGGAAAVDDDSDDYDVDDDDDVMSNTASNEKLATSTKTVSQRKKTAAIKSKVKVAMTSSSSSGSASSTTSKSAPKRKSLYRSHVPYIIRACLNPFTLIAMTKAYFVSLCDINYLKEEQTQTLRSALEEKARKQQPSSSGGPTKPKRKMKPGQAKTLSDLPQLSA